MINKPYIYIYNFFYLEYNITNNYRYCADFPCIQLNIAQILEYMYYTWHYNVVAK